MKKLNFIIHFIEFKYRLIYSILNLFFIFFTFFEYKIELFFLISESFLSLQKEFIYTSMLDPLIIYIKLVAIITLLFFFPFSLYIFCFFFIKSIYDIYIKIYCFFFSCLCLINFLIYYLFLNIFLNYLFLFFLSFERNRDNLLLKLQLEATMQQYFSFFSFFLLISFLLFIIPLLFFFFTNIFLLGNIFLKKFIFRKYLYFFIIFIFSIIAPPDIIIQLGILPIIFIIIEIYIYLFYFFKLFYTLYFNKIK